MKKLIALIILTLCLCGCSAQTPDVTANINSTEPTSSPSVPPSIAPTPEQIPTADVKTPEFTFAAPITDGLPEFIFEIFETEITELALYEYDVRISCDNLQQLQTLKIESSAKWTEDSGYIDLVDIDFDGYADIQAFTSSGMVNINYSYYRWNVFLGQGYGEFEEMPFFEMLTSGYELYPDTKQIISTSRDSAINQPREMYQLSDTQNGGWLGTYRLLRREEQELTPDGEIAVRIYFGDEEIYTKPVPPEGEPTSGNLDNYLRFGVGDPIDIEAATQLLYDEYGEADSSTGFLFSFTFEEMMVFEKLSCYKFRMQWLVDGSRWSTVGFVGVAPDGRIIEQID